MTNASLGTKQHAQQRIIGRYETGLPGPMLLAQGGIHGNEPAGVEALEAVVRILEERKIRIRGCLIAIAGNLAALQCKQRFLSRDLNRHWTQQDLKVLCDQDPDLDCNEDLQQRQLLKIYENCTSEPDASVLFVDLHSSSADGPPFTCLGDTRPNRRLAMTLPVPIVLGLEECIDGAVMDYFNRLGHAAIAVEGGRHDDPATIAKLTASIWHLMVAIGMLDANDIDLQAERAVLEQAGGHLPAIVEIRHRQVIQSEDEFVMEPGFTSFDWLRKNQLLATSRHGQHIAHEASLVLLPLYQGQGDDGYFLCRPVRPAWLKVSNLLRTLRLDRTVHWLPGIARDPEDALNIIVDPRIARWFVVEILHLLGFRKRGMIGSRSLFARRWANSGARKLGASDTRRWNLIQKGVTLRESRLRR